MKTSIQSKSTQTVLTIFLGCLVLLLAGFQLVSVFSLNKNEKTFEVSNCTLCNKDGCRPYITFTGFKVQPPQVLIYYVSDGIQRINTYPSDENTQCTILKENNFAFECNTSKRMSELVLMQSTIVFDGKNKYQSVNNTTFGTETVSSKTFCEVK